jgi:hypothetical protein
MATRADRRSGRQLGPLFESLPRSILEEFDEPASSPALFDGRGAHHTVFVSLSTKRRRGRTYRAERRSPQRGERHDGWQLFWYEEEVDLLTNEVYELTCEQGPDPDITRTEDHLPRA